MKFHFSAFNILQVYSLPIRSIFNITELQINVLQLNHPDIQVAEEDPDVDDGPHDGPDDNPKTKESEQLTDKHGELTEQISTVCLY